MHVDRFVAVVDYIIDIVAGVLMAFFMVVFGWFLKGAYEVHRAGACDGLCMNLFVLSLIGFMLATALSLFFSRSILRKLGGASDGPRVCA
ncbi:hypothetical protein [Aeropyrum pernix]|uniref:hypothetical protein n=1 Tax=Aeropyrum pernix TaxID=56636 RepID=UPI0011E54A40|nr:hypothetical protein [Aeropyrum pernix]